MTSEELHAMAVRIRVLAAIINKLAARDLERRLEARNAGVSGVQYFVLQTLKHRCRTISDMSREMMLAPATLVPVVDALERKGLVERNRDPHDRRRVPLRLTEDGLATLARMPLVDQQDSLVRSLAEMGNERTVQLWELLHDLVHRMAGRAGRDGGAVEGAHGLAPLEQAETAHGLGAERWPES